MSFCFLIQGLVPQDGEALVMDFLWGRTCSVLWPWQSAPATGCHRALWSGSSDQGADMQRPPWLVATTVHSVGLGGWPRSKHMDRTKKSWGKEEPANGGNAGWEGSGVDQLTGSSSAAQTPVPGPGLPSTCILATSWSTFWPTSSWLFCRAPQATSRSCSSCFSFPVSSDSLGAMAAGDGSPAGQMALGGPRDAVGAWTPRPSQA